MKLIYLESELKFDSFDVATDIKIPIFRVLVTIEPGHSLLQFVTTNCLIKKFKNIMSLLLLLCVNLIFLSCYLYHHTNIYRYNLCTTITTTTSKTNATATTTKITATTTTTITSSLLL